MRWILVLFALFALALPTQAQDPAVAPAPAYNPRDLAERFLDLPDTPTIPPVTPQYERGDTLEFWVGKTTQETPVRVDATLAAAAPNLYLWVEDGIPYDPTALNQFANLQLTPVFNVLRLRATYAEQSSFPAQEEVFDFTNLYPLPDVDNDPHLYILFTTDLAADRDGVYNPLDSLPAAYVPGGYSNEHEIIYINTSPFPDSELGSALYRGIIIRTLFRYIMDYNHPGQAPWLREALSWYMLFQFEGIQLGEPDVEVYFSDTNLPLAQVPQLFMRGPALSAQQLFLTYFAQRYGLQTLTRLFELTGPGLRAFDTALAEAGITDPVSGEDVTAADAFADFAVTNGVNFPFGDGRYVYTLDLPNGIVASATLIDDLSPIEIEDQTVNPYGTRYLRLGSPEERRLNFTFDGQPTSPRLPLPSSSDNRFYWSGGEAGQDATLTRAFDLRDVDEATLTFDTWYDREDYWNYAYVTVSTNGGEHWEILPTSNSTEANPYAVAYGPGFTGVSNPEGPRPFPTLGVLIAEDGMTIQEVVAGGPADSSDLRAGDRVIGYNGRVWQGAPNILGMLSEYRPDETVDLLVQRSSERLTIPVVLGAHESRIVEPTPLWLEQHVDLTAYVGQEILLRFESISVPGHSDFGIAVDNIAIAELEYADNAEAESDWTMRGWQIVDNEVEQQWLVQAVRLGTESRPPSVRQLIGPRDTATSGTWSFHLLPNEELLIAISAIGDDTRQAATFDLTMDYDE